MSLKRKWISLVLLIVAAGALASIVDAPGWVVADPLPGTSLPEGISPPAKISLLKRLWSSGLDNVAVVSPVPMKDIGENQAELDTLLEKHMAKEPGDAFVFQLSPEDRATLAALDSSQQFVIQLGRMEFRAGRWNPPGDPSSDFVAWMGYNVSSEPLTVSTLGQAVGMSLPNGFFAQTLQNSDILVVFRPKVPSTSTRASDPAGSTMSAESYGPERGYCGPLTETLIGPFKDVLKVGFVRAPSVENNDDAIAGLATAREWLEYALQSKALFEDNGFSVDKSLPAVVSGMTKADEVVLWTDLKSKGRQRTSKYHAPLRELANERDWDLVVVLSFPDIYGNCGQAARVPSDSENFVAIVDTRCLVRDTVVAHEVGHLIGAEHEPHLDRTPHTFLQNGDHAWRWPLLDSHGRYLPGRYEGTASASDVFTRCPFFSDPKRPIKGEPAGSTYANQVVALRRHVAIATGLAAARRALDASIPPPVPVPASERDLQPISIEQTSAPDLFDSRGDSSLGQVARPVAPKISLEASDTDRNADAPRSALVVDDDHICAAIRWRTENDCTNDAYETTLLFKRGEWEISRGHEAKLRDALGERQVTENRAVISGHASITGDFWSNVRLARNRANATSLALAKIADETGVKLELRVCALGQEKPSCGSTPLDPRATIHQRATVRFVSSSQPSAGDSP